ncbi:MAG: hypothetical protein V3T18_07500, partial [Pseudomonadales bacterium]
MNRQHKRPVVQHVSQRRDKSRLYPMRMNQIAVAQCSQYFPGHHGEKPRQLPLGATVSPKVIRNTVPVRQTLAAGIQAILKPSDLNASQGVALGQPLFVRRDH